MDARPAPASIPTDPGVYRFRDAHGRVIYVGKALSLRSRLNSYFTDPALQHPRTGAMLTSAATVDWVIVANEVEALSLEFTWIKEFEPRFNVKYRDDKSYPYVAVTVNEAFPRASVSREPRRKGTKYFGPYAHAWAIRETLDELSKVFGVRTCRDGVFKRAQQSGRACLLAYIDKCSAPCVGRIDESAYRTRVENLCKVLRGDTRSIAQGLREEMDWASNQENFEVAAKFRDRLGALERATERNVVSTASDTNADVIALHDSELEIGVQAFHVRDGRVVGERSVIVEKSEATAVSEYVVPVVQQLYAGKDRDGVEIEGAKPARDVLVSHEAPDFPALEAWLSERRDGAVKVRVPKRGDLRALMETASTNAEEALSRHRLKRASDLNARSQALEELTKYLGLAEVPLRIECVDISTLQGTDTVASLVVFEDGLPRKRDYRNYIIRTPDADDLAAVHEVVSRRFAPPSDECADAASNGEKFSYPTGLLVIDGAAAQVRAAAQALVDVGAERITVIGLAKRLEQVFTERDDDPLVLPRSSPALYLLQRIRDEAHRTAIAFHRKRRSRKLSASALDQVPGLGNQKARALLNAFGSVATIRQATATELQKVPGIGPALADQILQYFGQTAEHEIVSISNPTDPGEQKEF